MYVGGRKEAWLLDRVNEIRLEDVCVLTPGDCLDLLDKLTVRPQQDTEDYLRDKLSIWIL